MPRARALLVGHLLLVTLLVVGALPVAVAGPTLAPRYLLSLDHPLTASERAALAASGFHLASEAAGVPAAVVDTSPSASASPAALSFVGRATPDAPLTTDAGLLSPPKREAVTPVASIGAAPLTSRQEVSSTEEVPSALTRAGEPTWSLDATGKGVTIAVVDSGLDPTHPDFAGRVLANVKLVGTQFIPSEVDVDGHGTHVAGIAAGSGSASAGRYAGVAPAADLVGVDIDSDFTTASALQAFDWIFLHKDQYGIRVVTNSWGRASTGERFDPNDPLVKATDRLVRAGIVVIFSASNHGPGASTLSLEAQNPNVLTVGATDDAAALASFSSRGPAISPAGETADWTKPDLVAPGVDVVAPRSAGSVTQADPAAPSYQVLSGTSQAAPHVAGIVADMLSVAPALRPADVARILRATAIDLGARGPDADTGYGLVDSRDAVLVAEGDAPDHGNVLVAGGARTYAFTGTTLAAPSTPASDLLGGFGGGALARETTLTARFPVLPGADGVKLDFTWSSGAAPSALRIYLTDGDATLGPWTGHAGQASVAAPHLHSGMWTLAAVVTSVASVTWSASLGETLAAHGERASVVDPRYELPPGERGLGATLSDELTYALDLLTVELEVASTEFQAYATDHPIEVLGGVGAGFVTVLALAWLVFGGRSRAARRARRETLRGPPLSDLPPLVTSEFEIAPSELPLASAPPDASSPLPALAPSEAAERMTDDQAPPFGR